MNCDEFIAAKAGKIVAIFKAIRKARCNKFQQCVADTVPVDVVHFLEVVEIQIQNVAARIGVLARFEFFLDVAGKGHPIGQPCQRIV